MSDLLRARRDLLRRHGSALTLAGLGIAALAWATAARSAPAPSLEEMRREVSAASRPSPPWDGPVSGPPAEPNKTLALLCEDLRNGGILGVARGVEEAARVIG